MFEMYGPCDIPPSSLLGSGSNATNVSESGKKYISESVSLPDVHDIDRSVMSQPMPKFVVHSSADVMSLGGFAFDPLSHDESQHKRVDPKDHEGGLLQRHGIAEMAIDPMQTNIIDDPQCEDEHRLYSYNNGEQTVPFTSQLYTQELSTLYSQICQIHKDEYEEIRRFLQTKQKGYTIEMQQLESKQTQSLKTISELYQNKHNAVCAFSQKKKQLVKDNILKEMNRIRVRLLKYKKMPQHFCFVGCDFVTERSEITQHNAKEKQKISAIKLRIRRTANFTYQQFQTEITNLFSNWKNTLIENPQLSKPNTSKLKLHKYRFGLNHNELRADLDAMLTEHRRGTNQNEKFPSLPRMTRMMKRKQRAAAHSHNQSNGHAANETAGNTEFHKSANAKEGAESDSSVDESLLYQIHANMHGLAPLGFLNDPLCTIHSKKRRRSRKLISYREEISVSPSAQQKVAVLGPTSVKIDDQVICIGNRIKIQLLKENRSRRGTVIEIHKNQMLVETAKQQRWKVNFSDLKNGRINVHPSQTQK